MSRAWVTLALIEAPLVDIDDPASVQLGFSQTVHQVCLQSSAPPQVTLALTAPGPPGPPGDSIVSLQAGTTISALRAVYELDGQVYPLDAGDADHIELLVGVTTTAASAGGNVSVQRFGKLSDSGWAWTPGTIWLGANGALTQTPPTTGFDLDIGSATSATEIIIDSQPPIAL
ncbi:hypothetical protein [Marinobacterium litorale]|uniref:hypothetical protein n=1 Tax=Marinobacterium litorale TaxID=404770 RepID=UPI0004086BEF|nr:hypothetical protein [Marinobacterium litorale]